jgi:hypothetical protein
MDGVLHHVEIYVSNLEQSTPLILASSPAMSAVNEDATQPSYKR